MNRPLSLLALGVAAMLATGTAFADVQWTQTSRTAGAFMTASNATEFAVQNDSQSISTQGVFALSAAVDTSVTGVAGNSTATQTSALEPNAISGRGGFEANTSVTDPEGFADVFGQSFINAYFTLTEPTPYSLSGYITRGGIASAAMYLHNASTGFVHQLEPAADQTLTIDVSGTLPAGNYLISVNVSGFSQEAPPDLLTHASGEWQMDFTVGGTTDAPVIGGDVSLHVFPNPARDAATVSFANRAGERAAVSVYDLAGRVVRTLETTTATTRWDTRDSAGRPVPAGVYFVRVARGENVESSTVTVLR